MDTTGDPQATGEDAPTGLGLGTFLGVYTPTVLTILGVILYLRMGWVVGNAGVWGTVFIVLLANGITAITALSLSALSTNMRVGVGGAYYIISRSLGLELGGALGIPLYLSQVLSVTLYAYGLAESMRILWPEAPVQVLAAIVVVGVVLLAARSTMLALRMQLPIMVFIGLSLASLLIGIGDGPPQVPSFGPWEDGGFWVVFAVFFPAVTGILAGVGLSGDLKDASKAIPRGVLLAVVTGFAVYISMPYFLGRAADPATLRGDPLIWTKVAWVGALVMPGLWGAILSSAIGSILGAPRTLQALAQDRLAPDYLARLDKKTGEPMLALRLSGGIALLAVLLGDLNMVASVVTMFFLTTYGMLNLAAGLEELIKDPSYRPRIRVPWWVSLIGALGCFVAMFAINALACIAAVVIEGGIWWYLRRRALKATWGDLRTGLWMAMVRFAMVKLQDARRDARNWRPHILFFTADLRRNTGAVAVASHFSQDRGIVTVSTLVIGGMERRTEATKLQLANQKMLDAAGLQAFSEVVIVPELESGFMSVAQAHGIGGVDSNMVAFGWPGDNAVLLAPMLARVRHLAHFDKSTMWMRPVPGSRRQGTGEILVWWAGMEQNGDMMLLLAHLLSMADGWRNVHITLASVVATPEDAAKLREQVGRALESSRIPARIEPVVRNPEQAVADVIRARSRRCDLVFLGLPVVEPGEELAAAERLITLVRDLPSAILVRNGGPFRGQLV